MNAINTIPETISVLETYNKWRRGDETIPQPEPFEIGGAIDAAVRLLRELAAERDQLRAEVERLDAEKLKKLWGEFITLMEITEESDSGNKFNPNKISSCRALDGRKLNELLVEAQKIVFNDKNT